MHKRDYAQLISAQGEIDELRQQVIELSWDEPFGMLTRGAFLQFCRRQSGGEHRLAFIDLDDLGALNYRYGYAEVDRRVKASFSIFEASPEIVARWYSGDEIVILFANGGNPQYWLAALDLSARRAGLSFTHASGLWQAGCQPVEQAVQALSERAKLNKPYAEGGYR